MTNHLPPPDGNVNPTLQSRKCDQEIVRLIDAGLAILPVRGKAPDTSLAPHGVYSATTDIDLVAQWLRAGLGIGATSPSGSVLHLDIDPRNGGTQRALEPLVGTWAYFSGRGDGGLHVLFKVPDSVELGRGKLGPGIDVLGKGRYGVVPPSVHPDSKQPYQWAAGCAPSQCELATLPGHLLERLQRTPSRESQNRPVEITEELVVSAMYCVDPSDYAIWRNTGMALKDLDWPTSWELFDQWSRAIPQKYNRANNIKLWNSFGRRRDGPKVTIATVFYYALSNGWEPPWHADENEQYVSLTEILDEVIK